MSGFCLTLVERLVAGRTGRRRGVAHPPRALDRWVTDAGESSRSGLVVTP